MLPIPHAKRRLGHHRPCCLLGHSSCVGSESSHYGEVLSSTVCCLLGHGVPTFSCGFECGGLGLKMLTEWKHELGL